jgi:hypothetical protein
VIVDVLAVASLPGHYSRRVSRLQRGHDRADAGVADHAVGSGHRVDHIVEGHELDPGGVRHRRPRRRAPVLDDELLPAPGDGLDQVERPGEGLLVGAEANEDQRRSPCSGRACKNAGARATGR